jgi:hypothetical protein
MKRATSSVLTCLACIGLSLTCNAATTESLLERGIRETRYAEFEKAIETLEQVIAQLETRQNRANDLARAYIYLSIAHLELAQESTAKAQFLAALAIDEGLELSEFEYPPRILRFFNRIRKGIRAPQQDQRAPSDEASGARAIKAAESSFHPSNIVLNPGFEELVRVQVPSEWIADAWQGGAILTLDDSQAHSGQFSARVAASSPNDARWIQTIAVVPDTQYVLSGWIKTKDVRVVDGPTRVGANLCLHDTWNHTTGVLGTTDWAYQEMIFNSYKRTEVIIACRLGYWAGTAMGTMWCDDIVVRPRKIADAP